MNETIALVALAGLLGLGAGLIAAMVSNASQGRGTQHRLASKTAPRRAPAGREQYEPASPYPTAGGTLPGDHLASKHLMRAKLARADLQGAAAGEANVGNADLRDATPRDAKPRRATNMAATLEGTDPCAVDLEEASLNGTTVSDARLSGARLDQTAPNTLPLPDSCEDKFLFALWLGRHLSRD
jgi:uncharacterized protein YjbI with pentapeptide repeats